MARGIREDIEKLAKDNQRFKSGLDKLEQDHAVWAVNREKKDLQEITNHLKQLELDVGVMVRDCSLLVGRDDGDGLREDLRHAYVHLNSLFEDVKKARTDLERTYIKRGEIGQMEIDWGRLKKAVVEIAARLEK